MNHIEMVESWVAWYAIKQNYTKVISALCSRDNGPSLYSLGVPVSAVAAVTLRRMVADEDVGSFVHGIDIINTMYEALKDQMEPSLVLRITSAMKCKVMFALLKQKAPNIVSRLKGLFPRDDTQQLCDNMEASAKSRVLKCEGHFRSFFLTLVANTTYQRNYMQSQYLREFGTKFDNKLRELVDRFLTVVWRNYHRTPIEKILQEGSGSEFVSWLHHYNLAAVEILLDEISDVSTLTEAACLRLLEMLRPPSETGLRHKDCERGGPEGWPLTQGVEWFESQRPASCISVDQTHTQDGRFTALKRPSAESTSSDQDIEIIEVFNSEKQNAIPELLQVKTQKRLHSDSSSDNNTKKRQRQCVDPGPDTEADMMDSSMSRNKPYPRGRLYRMKSKSKETQPSQDVACDRTGSELVIGSAINSETPPEKRQKTEEALKQRRSTTHHDGQDRTGSGTGETGSGASQTGSGTGQTGSSTGQTGSGAGQTGSDAIQTGSDAGSGASQTGSDAGSGASQTESGADGPGESCHIFYEVVTRAEAADKIPPIKSQHINRISTTEDTPISDMLKDITADNHGDIASNHGITVSDHSRTVTVNKQNMPSTRHCPSELINNNNNDQHKPCVAWLGDKCRTVTAEDGDRARSTSRSDSQPGPATRGGSCIPDQVDIISSSSSQESMAAPRPLTPPSRGEDVSSQYHTSSDDYLSCDGVSLNTVRHISHIEYSGTVHPVSSDTACDGDILCDGDISSSDGENVTAEVSYITGSSCGCEEMESCIIPSSHSLDKFDAICVEDDDQRRHLLPSIDQHLRPPDCKNCVIKLHHDKELDQRVDLSRVQLYS